MSRMLGKGARPFSGIAAACALAAILGAPAGLADSRATGLSHAVHRGLRSQAGRLRCRPGADSSTIAQSPAARLFTAPDGNDYACLYSVGRAFYLSSAEHYEYRLVHFSGPYVAYVQNVAASDDNVGELD